MGGIRTKLRSKLWSSKYIIDIYKLNIHVSNMKLKDFVTIARNKRNNQTNLTLRKTKLKGVDMTEEDILNIIIRKDFK